MFPGWLTVFECTLQPLCSQDHLLTTDTAIPVSLSGWTWETAGKVCALVLAPLYGQDIGIQTELISIDCLSTYYF
jgi:hypothetical protein